SWCTTPIYRQRVYAFPATPLLSQRCTFYRLFPEPTLLAVNAWKPAVLLVQSFVPPYQSHHRTCGQPAHDSVVVAFFQLSQVQVRDHPQRPGIPPIQDTLRGLELKVAHHGPQADFVEHDQCRLAESFPNRLRPERGAIGAAGVES